MKIFLDTNVILDYFQNREGVGAVLDILDLVNVRKDCRIYVSYLSIADSAYILRKTHDNEKLKHTFKEFLQLCDVLPMNDMQIYEAVRSGTSPDFEDNLQIICAEYGGCDLIISHNLSHFRGHTDVPVLSPQEFVSHCCVES